MDIYISILLGCFMVIALLHFYTINSPFWDRIIREAFWAIFSAVFVLAFVDLIKDEAEDEAHQTEFKKIITDAITLNDNFTRVLNEESIDKLLIASISHYADNIASSYVDYIKNHSDIYRSNFKYKVSLSLDRDNNTEITHDVRYRKHFKVNQDTNNYKLKVYFAIKNGGLDSVMGDDSIFFREELLHTPFVAKINNIIENNDYNDDTIKHKIIELIGLSFTLYDNTNTEHHIDSNLINMIITSDGIMFSHDIDNRLINKVTTPTNDTYIDYEAKVCCGYETYRENQFYCIFPNPTTDCQFEISFDKDIVNNIDNDVNYITMLSLDDDKACKINRYSKQRIIEFETSKTIFPRSGILVQWNKK